MALDTLLSHAGCEVEQVRTASPHCQPAATLPVDPARCSPLSAVQCAFSRNTTPHHHHRNIWGLSRRLQAGVDRDPYEEIGTGLPAVDTGVPVTTRPAPVVQPPGADTV